MKILMLGSGKDVWTIRGVQLGCAIGARLPITPSRADFEWADVLVLIKRAPVAHAKQMQALGKPVVWDPVDFWAQPVQNSLSEVSACALLRRAIEDRQPVLTIGATERMARDAGGVCLHHHSLIGLTPTPARDRVQMVAYSGNALFLGRWKGVLETLCRARGWTFAVNPPRITDADILVALRDGPFDGWMCRHWKSGVKVANAVAAGRPLICQEMASVRELQPAGYSVVETVEDLASALDHWADTGRRRAVAESSLDGGAARFHLDTMAAQYRQLLEAVACPA